MERHRHGEVKYTPRERKQDLLIAMDFREWGFVPLPTLGNG